MNRRNFFKSIVAGIAGILCLPKSYPWKRVGVQAQYDDKPEPRRMVVKKHAGMGWTEELSWKAPDITGPTDTLYIGKEKK